MTRSVLVLLAFVACKGDDAVVESDDTDTDTDTEVPAPDQYSGFIDAPTDLARPSSLQAGLVQAAWSGDALVLGATLAATRLSGTGVFQIVLPDEVDAGWLVDRDGVVGAWFVPMVFDDDDDDGQYSVGETIGGVNLDRWLVFGTGTGPDGWPEGWGLTNLHQDEDGVAPTFESLEFEGEIVLRGLEAKLNLRGTWTPTGDGRAIAGLDAHWLDGSGSVVPTFDQLLDKAYFAASLNQRPAQAHWFDHPNGLRYGLEINQVYVDVDGDGEWTPGTDTFEDQTTCWDGEVVYERYVEGSDTIGRALELAKAGWTAGWRAVTVDSAGDGPRFTELGPDESGALLLDGCTLAR